MTVDTFAHVGLRLREYHLLLVNNGSVFGHYYEGDVVKNLYIFVYINYSLITKCVRPQRIVLINFYSENARTVSISRILS